MNGERSRITLCSGTTCAIGKALSTGKRERLVVWLFALTIGATWAAEGKAGIASDAVARTVRGEVVATNVTDDPHTIVVKVMMPNREELTVGASVPSGAAITRGKRSVDLADVKIGEAVTLIYLKKPEGLVVRSIHLHQ